MEETVRKVIWYARTDEILRMGPYRTMLKACAAVMGADGYPVKGSYVWCEESPKEDPEDE